MAERLREKERERTRKINERSEKKVGVGISFKAPIIVCQISFIQILLNMLFVTWLVQLTMEPEGGRYSEMFVIVKPIGNYIIFLKSLRGEFTFCHNFTCYVRYAEMFTIMSFIVLL